MICKTFVNAVGRFEQKEDARYLLKKILDKLPDEESKRLDKIRRIRRQHIREVKIMRRVL